VKNKDYTEMVGCYKTWNMCRRKKQYKTYQRAIKDENILRCNLSQNVHIYECPLCGKWHIGHETIKKRPDN
jgi:hypothetical protein